MYECALDSLNSLAYVLACDACVTSTDANKAYKVALGGGLLAWSSN